MIKIIPSDKRHFNDFGWLQTYWLFSFSNYYDPENIQFEALRVFNDDIVKPGKGFPTHPHKEMEIITIVLDGEMTHKDSMGNISRIKAGDVQRMSAGTGLTHSEFNYATNTVNFYQIWLFPDEHKLQPSYDQLTFNNRDFKNDLYPVASGHISNTVTFHTDATIYMADLDKDFKLNYEPAEKRRTFVYVTKGQLDINGNKIGKKDQARIDLEKNLDIQADTNTQFVLLDIPSCEGFGYDINMLRGDKRSGLVYTKKEEKDT